MRDLVTVPALLGGALFVTEAVASPWVEPHWGYHAINVPLSVVVALAAWGLLRREGPALGRVARVGAWTTAVAAIGAAAGGLVPLALEPTGIGESPGILEGIVHTVTLVVFLGLALLGIGQAARRGAPARAAMGIMGGGAAVAIVLVIAGFDSPWVFLVPEAACGIGLAWVGLGAGRATSGPQGAAA